MIASAVTVSNINEIFEDPEGEVEEDRNRYRAVAGFLVFVGIAGIITQAVLTIARALYYGEVITSQFTVFGIIVSYIIKYLVSCMHIYNYVTGFAKALTFIYLHLTQHKKSGMRQPVAIANII